MKNKSETPTGKKFAVKNYEEMTIGELVGSIRGKIQRTLENKAQNNKT